MMGQTIRRILIRRLTNRIRSGASRRRNSLSGKSKIDRLRGDSNFLNYGSRSRSTSLMRIPICPTSQTELSIFEPAYSCRIVALTEYEACPDRLMIQRLEPIGGFNS